MSRRIDLLDDALLVRYAGLDAALGLRRHLRVPYASIRSVAVGLGDPPGPLAWRLGLSTPPFGTTQRGRFRREGGWSFLDVDDRERALVLDLEGHEFNRVALTVDDPQALAQQLRERSPLPAARQV
jgi:hypothetical protein